MKLNVIFVLFWGIATCYAQVPDVKIQKEKGDFYAKDQLIENVNYIITNNEEVPIWIWFSPDNTSLLNNSQKIRQYFKSFSAQSDGSYYQWMCDGNVASFTASLFFSFVKVLPPGEHFYISFIHHDIDVSEIQLFIDTHLNIVLEKEIVKLCPGVNDDSVKKKFTFCPSIISIPWNDSIKALWHF